MTMTMIMIMIMIMIMKRRQKKNNNHNNNNSNNNNNNNNNNTTTTTTTTPTTPYQVNGQTANEARSCAQPIATGQTLMTSDLSGLKALPGPQTQSSLDVIAIPA